jgi:hypothetical protein
VRARTFVIGYTANWRELGQDFRRRNGKIAAVNPDVHPYESMLKDCVRVIGAGGMRTP